jgi:hypothetical protein
LAGEKARSEHLATKEFPTSLEEIKADNLRSNAREDREDKCMIFQNREQATGCTSENSWHLGCCQPGIERSRATKEPNLEQTSKLLVAGRHRGAPNAFAIQR